MKKTIEIFSYELNEHLILGNTGIFCKQIIKPSINFDININGDNIILNNQIYKSVIECCKDDYLIIGNISLLSKILIKSINFFSQKISTAELNLIKKPSDDILYIIENNKIIDSVKCTEKIVNLQNYIGKIVSYRPEFTMNVIKLEIKNHNGINSWTLESEETINP